MERGDKVVNLRTECCEANLRLHASGIVDFTFGNVSVVDRSAGTMAIKPSGVDYGALTPESIVVLRLDDGAQIESSLNPSTDAPTHRRLYQALPLAGCVVHTHSRNAVAFAQAGMPIPCLGTTHADYFDGEIPVTRELTDAEIEKDYEWNSGTAVAEVGDRGAALLRNHGVFVWDVDWRTAVEKAAAVEVIAEMALKTILLSGKTGPISANLLRKHFDRKHGGTAYYGQKKP
jgi:L-ribulose-5-phosphate 4-epimerase